MIDKRKPRRILLGLMGAGIQASRTPAMHEREAAAQGLHCLYQPMDIERPPHRGVALEDLLCAAERTGFTGVNITHPFKQAVLPLLDEVSGDAQALGAVNTVVFRDGRRCGYNTDWLAFRRSFEHGMEGAAMGRVAQLGAGGAGAATAFAMLAAGAGRVEIADVDAGRRDALVARLAGVYGSERVTGAEDAEAAIGRADGLIHATPTGMYGHEGMAVKIEWLRAELWVAEVVYFPLETALLKTARAAGCRTLDGSGMAVRQAVEAFRLFTGLEADPERMHETFLSLG